MNQFDNFESLNNYVIKKVLSLHNSSNSCIFLGGSFARGGETKLSDIDYTVSTDEKIDHPKFYFEIVELKGILRLLSIYFNENIEILPGSENITDEEYLWLKKMFPETKFIAGNERLYQEMCEFYRNLNYSRKIKLRTVHKSYGKLLELIARIKKWNQKGDFVEMVYYGTKMAEHVRRLVIEINGPIAVKSENLYLEEHFNLPKLPKDFKKLFLEVNRYSTREISLDEYQQACIELVLNTSVFMKDNITLLDEWTKDLLNTSSLEDYITQH